MHYENKLDLKSYKLDKFRTIGWMRLGTLAEELLDKPTMDLMNLKKCDVIVLSVGANDVYRIILRRH
jgi:hypothetical protein